MYSPVSIHTCSCVRNSMITNAQSQHWEISITWICACVHVAHMAHVCTWHSPVRDMCCAHARRMWAHASESPPPPSLLSLFCPHCRCLRRCHCAGLLPSSDLLPVALRIHSCSGCFHDRLIFQRKAYRIALVLSLPGVSVAPPTWDCRPNPQIRRFAVALCCDALLSQDFDLLNWTLCSLNDCSERLFVVTKKKWTGPFSVSHFPLQPRHQQWADGSKSEHRQVQDACRSKRCSRTGGLVVGIGACTVIEVVELVRDFTFHLLSRAMCVCAHTRDFWPTWAACGRTPLMPCL